MRGEGHTERSADSQVRSLPRGSVYVVLYSCHQPSGRAIGGANLGAQYEFGPARIFVCLGIWACQLFFRCERSGLRGPGVGRLRDMGMKVERGGGREVLVALWMLFWRPRGWGEGWPFWFQGLGLGVELGG